MAAILFPNTMKTVTKVIAWTVGSLVGLGILCLGFIYWYDKAGQQPDPMFNASVSSPANTVSHPRVLIDAAHNNWHTMTGRYRPLANLLRADGYDVQENRQPFSLSTLDSVNVLVIANALGPPGQEDRPAFTPQEDTVLPEWVRRGGSLLLVADHVPFGAAAKQLAKQFGVKMYLAFARDDEHSGWDNEKLVFSRENGLLVDHPITRGRSRAEQLDTVRTFTGQSLSVPPGATPILKLGPHAYDWESRSVRHPAAGHAQGIAMPFGSGRVVILGEAGVLSAQVDPLGFKMGMNASGNNDKQFALNLLHWLSHLT